MTNTAIASTQRAGEGDAVILGNNSQPVINTILKEFKVLKGIWVYKAIKVLKVIKVFKD